MHLAMRPSILRTHKASYLQRSVNWRQLHTERSHLYSPKSLLYIHKIDHLRVPRAFQNLIAHHVSTSTVVSSKTRSIGVQTKSLVLGTVIGVLLVFGFYYVTDTRAGIHQWVVVPSLRWVYDDAEDAHEAGTKALKGLYRFGIHPRERGDPDRAEDLEVEVRGISEYEAVIEWD